MSKQNWTQSEEKRTVYTVEKRGKVVARVAAHDESFDWTARCGADGMWKFGWCHTLVEAQAEAEECLSEKPPAGQEP